MNSAQVLEEKLNNSRYQSILKAAAKIFREKEFHHANISDIAKKVGLQKGSLYYHIKSKEELLFQISTFAVTQCIANIDAIISENKRADILIKKAIIAHMAPDESLVDRYYVGLHEYHNLSSDKVIEIRKYFLEYRLKWISIIEKGKLEGIFKQKMNSGIILSSIYGMCNWSFRWYRSDREFNRRQIAAMFADIILEGILE